MVLTGNRLILQGIGSSPGIIVGKAVILMKDKYDIKPVRLSPDLVDSEVSDFKNAVARVKNDLVNLAQTVGQRIAPEYARIFEAQVMIADDDVINSKIIEDIKSKQLPAAYLYHQQVKEVLSQLSKSSDIYLRERTLDIESVCSRILILLQGMKKSIVTDVRGPTVVIASNLSPGDLLGFSVRKKVGFAMEVGGVTSHTSLLAKSLNLPSVVGLGTDINQIKTGERIILDGFAGKLYVNPDQDILKEYRNRQKFQTSLKLQYSELKAKPAETLDGCPIKIMGNIELPGEVTKVVKSGAVGIGLYRTEYLFLNSNRIPGMDQQFQVYKAILRKMNPAPVIIRTYDLGGDKFADSAFQTVDPNPFLGWRAIRFCLDNPQVFKDQIKALLKASVYGNLEIMLPMISNLDEVLETKKLINECKAELKAENIKIKDKIPLGIMIEVPSAVILAEHLAEEVDFFSLGTNDLVQYVLAVDRSNELLAHLYQSFNPAVLMMIKRAIDAGHSKGIRIGICGELAADPIGVILLVGLGIDELSVNHLSVGLVKKIVCSISKKHAVEIAREACRKKTTFQVEKYLKEKIELHFPDLLPLIDFIKGLNHD